MKTAMDIAQELIDLCEKSGPYSVLCWDDVEPLILELGGKSSVIRECQHSATICIYIAALMVRRQEQQP